MITFIAHMRVKPENVAAYEAIMAHVTAKTRENEPGVLYYAMSKSVAEPDTFMVVEVYRDKESWAAHMATEWVTSSIPKSAALMDGKVDIKQYVTAGTEPIPMRSRMHEAQEALRK